MIEKYSNSIGVSTYPSGERRVTKDPAREIMVDAFQELGTYSAVASAFGVCRGTVKRLVTQYQLNVVSHPEIGLAQYIQKRLRDSADVQAVSQWIMDEGSVSVTYFRRTDLTSLIVCGSMNDFEVLGRISSILNAPITGSKSPAPTILPLGAVKVHAAKAYALLEVIRPHLAGLKAMEAKAALEFFPRSGSIRGRHTTDEFLVLVWQEFAQRTLESWNSKRVHRLDNDELARRASTWVEGRIRRARRFVDDQFGRAEGLPSARPPLAAEY